MRTLAKNFRIMKFKEISYILALTIALTVRTQEPDGRGFEKPEQAVQALRVGLAAHDLSQLRQIFGTGFDQIINDDLVEATNEFTTVASAMQESNSLLPVGTNRMTLEYGPKAERFPIPLVKTRGKWFFDTVAGAEEVINRRIGRNEITVLEILRTYVQAQREYAATDRDGDEVLEYAQKFRSTPGLKDGLYWEPEIDGSRSPLGPLAAEAELAGYTRQTDSLSRSFHGYYFKILTRQGKNAPGGEYNYVINGNMIGGFALVASPAEYDECGVMTFIVNQQGVVYQKDLGTNTAAVVTAMNTYDPDSSWKQSAD